MFTCNYVVTKAASILWMFTMFGFLHLLPAKQSLSMPSPDFVNCFSLEAVPSTIMCGPTPATSLHFTVTATSGDPCIFRDGFQLFSKPIGWVLQRQFQLWYVLSNAGFRAASEDFLRVSFLLSHNYFFLCFSYVCLSF